MLLKQYLEITWGAIKYFKSIKDNYIPGTMYYRLTEMDFDDFIVKTYISEKLITEYPEKYRDCKNNGKRFNINKTVKKYFGHGKAFIEHIVPRTYILKHWYKYIDDNDIDGFTEYLREEASICILTKEEDKLLHGWKGRENLKKGLAVYRERGIKIEDFYFSYERKLNK